MASAKQFWSSRSGAVGTQLQALTPGQNQQGMESALVTPDDVIYPAGGGLLRVPPAGGAAAEMIGTIAGQLAFWDAAAGQWTFSTTGPASGQLPIWNAALNTWEFANRGQPNYLDAVDSPVLLTNFNDTLVSQVGPTWTVGALGTTTQVAFTDMVPGFRCIEIQGAQLVLPVTPNLQIAGDLEIEMIVFYDSSPTNHIMLSHGGTGGTAASNKLYEMFFLTPNYPRNWRFSWENGVAVAQSFTTPATALAPSLPPIHNMISLGWTRAANVVTPFLSGRQFSAASAALPAPAGGTSGFLTLGGDALAANNTSFLCASLAIYDYVRTPAQRKASYNRSLGQFWGPIP